MTLLAFAKSTLGPIIEASAFPGAHGLQQLAGAGAKPAKLMMLIDTGADETVVDEDLIVAADRKLSHF